MAVLDDILLHCQNSTTLEAAHALLQTLMSSSQFLLGADSPGSLMAILGDMGFGGLWRMCSLDGDWEPDQRCFALTERLIEVVFTNDSYVEIVANASTANNHVTYHNTKRHNPH